MEEQKQLEAEKWYTPKVNSYFIKEEVSMRR